jgi:predicted TIM-barrel fold metal-dependent hydrolase
MSHERSAAHLRASLDHPVIDADGHWSPYAPALRERMRRIGGDLAAAGFAAAQLDEGLRTTVAERRHRRRAQGGFWTSPRRNTRDRATSLFPRLLHERLDELGIDFAVLYAAGPVAAIADTPTRRATCRAWNVLTAEMFAPFADRLSPVALIPTHDPDEAIAELEFARLQLGHRVAVLGGLVRRPVPALAATHPEAALLAPWRDTLALDSEHDYDPLWQACLRLGVSPTFHAGARGSGLHASPSNFVYNHIGHFAAAGEALCKAMFLGGVTRRFPGLRFSFLEGGVAWACSLYASLVSHWRIRNARALELTRPSSLDTAELLRLARGYADPDYVAAIAAGEGISLDDGVVGGIDNLDDFAACGIERAEDIARLFVDRFYFGCEADDPTNAWGFRTDTNPFGARLNAIFGSDIGHFDVPDMAQVLPEAHEPVEDGRVTAADFRDFTFANAVRFFTATNPAFFDGTSVAAAARAVRDAAVTRAAAAVPPA